jgi:hypothetical protein
VSIRESRKSRAQTSADNRVCQGRQTARTAGDHCNALASGDYVPGFEASASVGVGVPSSTPAEIIDRLNNEINAMLADPKMKVRLADLGGVPLPITPADFAKIVADETEEWGKVIRGQHQGGSKNHLPPTVLRRTLGVREASFPAFALHGRRRRDLIQSPIRYDCLRWRHRPCCRRG